jgi:hypothetical protein
MGQLENKIEEEKTKLKLEAMKNTKRNMVSGDTEQKALESQGKIFIPGQCLPEEIQKLKTADKLCIVGFAPSWTDTPWDDESYNIWGINELYLQMKMKYGKECRFTHWWEIHNIFSPSKNSPPHHKWLSECKVPVFMQKVYEQVPTSVPIPKDFIVDFFNQNFIINKIGASFTDYSNQIAVMIACAIAMGYKEIHVYGVDMAQASEYSWQRASCQFFIGYAAGLGIKVLIPLNSELCKYPAFYGFNTDNYARMSTKARINQIKEAIKQLNLQSLAEEFERSEQKRLYGENNKIHEMNLQRMDDELLRLDILHNKNVEMETFLKSAPNTNKDFNRKIEDVLLKFAEQNKKTQETIKQIEENKIKTLKEKKILDQQNYMQETSFNSSKENLKLTMVGYQGIIGECKRLLDNNIV